MTILEPVASRAGVALAGFFAHQAVRAGGKALELDGGGSILGQQAGEDTSENDSELFHNFSHCIVFPIAEFFVLSVRRRNGIRCVGPVTDQADFPLRVRPDRRWPCGNGRHTHTHRMPKEGQRSIPQISTAPKRAWRFLPRPAILHRDSAGGYHPCPHAATGVLPDKSRMGSIWTVFASCYVA